ncbi:MAG: HAD family phosphatase [Paracoccus sp. (in: a-proteobacteria)]|nr:HAD family phosphatase [Paracoccus sp. (in: a-proteobacteria)]
MAAIRAVIFDLDGCLVDSEVMSLETLAAEMSAEGMPTTADTLRREVLGVSIQSIVDRLARSIARPVSPDFIMRFEDRLLARYPGELRLIPGVPALLDDLAARGIQVAIATGGSLRRLAATLEISGLAARFQGRAFSADQVARGKPAPDLFQLAAKGLDLPPAACAVMEDAPHGITGAVAAGMRAVGFTGGSHLAGIRHEQARRLSAVGAACVLSDLDGMATALLAPRGPAPSAPSP